MSKQPKQMRLMLQTSPKTEFLDLPKHLIQKLTRHELNLIGEIAILDEHQLQKIPGIGPAAIQQIERALAKKGLHFDLPSSHVIELFQLPETHREMAHDSPNKRLRTPALEARNKAIYLAHKGGFDNLKIARKFRISKQTVAKAIKDERKREYRNVIAPQMVQEMARAGRAGEVPFSIFQGYDDNRTGGWAVRVLGGNPALGEVVALYRQFTYKHLRAYVPRFDEDLPRLRELFGDLNLPSQEEFDAAAAERISRRSEEADWLDVRYIDWDTRPQSHFAGTRNIDNWRTWSFRSRWDFHPEMTLGDLREELRSYGGSKLTPPLTKSRTEAEREYKVLEELVERYGGPRFITQMIQIDRGIWDKHEGRAVATVAESNAPLVLEAPQPFRDRHPIASGLLSAKATAAAICAAALTFG